MRKGMINHGRGDVRRKRQIHPGGGNVRRKREVNVVNVTWQFTWIALVDVGVREERWSNENERQQNIRLGQSKHL